MLQRYERQRQAGNLEGLALTDGLYRMFKLRTPGWDALRELGMSLVGRAGMDLASAAPKYAKVAAAQPANVAQRSAF